MQHGGALFAVEDGGAGGLGLAGFRRLVEALVVCVCVGVEEGGWVDGWVGGEGDEEEEEEEEDVFLPGGGRGWRLRAWGLGAGRGGGRRRRTGCLGWPWLGCGFGWVGGWWIACYGDGMMMRRGRRRMPPRSSGRGVQP